MALVTFVLASLATSAASAADASSVSPPRPFIPGRACGTAVAIRTIEKVPADGSDVPECAFVKDEGHRNRTRRCRKKNDGPEAPDLDPGECGGGPTDLQTTCDLGLCHRWGQWTQWTDCTASCGVGTRSRGRDCEDVRGGTSTDCVGESSAVEECRECCGFETNLGDTSDSVVYWDSHVVECPSADGELFLSHWKLELEQAGTKQKFVYTCCPPPGPPGTSCSPVQYITQGSDHIGPRYSPNLHYLDRQTALCPNYGMMKKFYLNNDGGEYAWYEVGCCDATNPGTSSPVPASDWRCDTFDTPVVESGGGYAQFLDRTTVQCPPDTFLSSFGLKSDGPFPPQEYHYEVTCCGVEAN